MRRLHALLVTLLLLLGFGAASSAVADEPMRVPGTHVSIVPPARFTLSKRFQGLQDEQRAASITVSEIPQSLEALLSGLTAEELKPRGMVLRESKAQKFGAREGRLVRVEQSMRGALYEKWMALVGNEQESALIVATYPVALSEDLREDVRSAVLTTTWEPELELGRFDGLPFQIREPKQLRIINRYHTLLTLSTPGTQVPVPATQPSLVVGASFAPMSGGSLEEFARSRLEQTPQIGSLEKIEGTTLEVGGRPAFELVAKGKYAESEAPVGVYQVIVADGMDYTIVQGAAPADQFETFLPEFRSVTESLDFASK